MWYEIICKKDGEYHVKVCTSFVWKVWSFGGYIASSMTRILVRYLEAKGSPESQKFSMSNVWGCLSTQVSLKDKGIQCNIECVKCDSSYEDLANMIYTCPFAMQVWVTDGIWNNIQQVATDTSTTVEAIFLLLQRFTPELAALMVSLF